MKKTSQSIARVIQATERLCSLPAIPTQDWASEVANALADLSPTLIVGVLIAHLDAQSYAINPISTGVSQIQSDLHSTDSGSVNKALYLQDKLERVTSLGFQPPTNTLARGLVAPFSLLHQHWATTPIGRIFAAQHLQNPILAIIPITDKNPGFVLIIILANDNELINQKFSTHSPESVDRMTETLSGLLPVISSKASLALEQVSNPKAWLTDREHEILDQLILGYSVRVIAGNLGRSAHTVHDHVKNLHKKLGASSRGELIAKALGYRPSPDNLAANDTQPASNPIILTGSSLLAELKPQPQTAIHARPLRQATSGTKPQT